MVHWSKGDKREETIEKIKLNRTPIKYWLDKKRSEETKEKISKNRKGKSIGHPSYVTPEGIKKSSATMRRLYAEGKLVPHNKGAEINVICKSCKDEFIVPESMSERKFCSRECWWDFKKVNQSNSPPVMSGEDSHFWKDGKSFEEYPKEFNNELKESIRLRDKYRCQQCFRHQSELFNMSKEGIVSPRKLDIHHIDYCKTNNEPDNLISLCRGCHTQTNFKREDWTDYFNGRNI